jgi:histidinol-phosphate aminotransferase
MDDLCMKRTHPHAHPGVYQLPVYVGGKGAVPGMRSAKLSSNENPFGCADVTKAAYAAAVEKAHIYPEGTAKVLREAIAAHEGIDAARIVGGSGSDELLFLLARAYMGPGDAGLKSQYGFMINAIATRQAGAEVVSAVEGDAFTPSVDAYLAAITPNTKVVFVANPNNPTGAMLPMSEIERLHASLPQDVLLIVDEAYYEFAAGEPGYGSALALATRSDNVVVLRTFSKAYGLAGVRAGWAYGPDHVVDVLNRLRSPFNVNWVAQLTAAAAMTDQAFVQKTVDHTRTWRGWLAAALRDLGYEVHAGVCNFVLVGFSETPGQTAADADAFLQSRGLIVRPLNPYGLTRYLRISIGLEDDCKAVVAALSDFAKA